MALCTASVSLCLLGECVTLCLSSEVICEIQTCSRAIDEPNVTCHSFHIYRNEFVINESDALEAESAVSVYAPSVRILASLVSLDDSLDASVDEWVYCEYPIIATENGKSASDRVKCCKDVCTADGNNCVILKNFEESVERLHDVVGCSHCSEDSCVHCVERHPKMSDSVLYLIDCLALTSKSLKSCLCVDSQLVINKAVKDVVAILEADETHRYRACALCEVRNCPTAIVTAVSRCECVNCSRNVHYPLCIVFSTLVESLRIALHITENV